MSDFLRIVVGAVDIVLLVAELAYLIGDDLKSKESRNVSIIVCVTFVLNLIVTFMR